MSKKKKSPCLHLGGDLRECINGWANPITNDKPTGETAAHLQRTDNYVASHVCCLVCVGVHLVCVCVFVCFWWCLGDHQFCFYRVETEFSACLRVKLRWMSFCCSQGQTASHVISLRWSLFMRKNEDENEMSVLFCQSGAGHKITSLMGHFFIPLLLSSLHVKC